MDGHDERDSLDELDISCDEDPLKAAEESDGCDALHARDGDTPGGSSRPPSGECQCSQLFGS